MPGQQRQQRMQAHHVTRLRLGKDATYAGVFEDVLSPRSEARRQAREKKTACGSRRWRSMLSLSRSALSLPEQSLYE